MEKRVMNREIDSVIQPVCEALRLHLIEASMRKNGNVVDFSIVIDRPGGISTEDCALLHQTLFLKLQTLYKKNIGLEISSPGLDRTLKYEDELSLFAGRRVRWLEKGAVDYLSGTIVRSDNRTAVFQTETGEERAVPVDNIIKAKLNG